MSTIRQQRVAELLFEELTIMIGGELADPRLSLVRVTRVDVSRDLRNVNVHVTHDDEDLSRRDILQGLRHATPYLRRQIAVRTSLRAVPELAFHYDDTPEKAARVSELLRQIAASRTEENGSEENGSGEAAANAQPDQPAMPPPTQQE